MNILENIVAHKKKEIAAAKALVSIDELAAKVETARKPTSLSNALQNSLIGIIAEFKRKSPSKGWIHPEADVEEIVSAYSGAGATGISVLADEHFFGASGDDLSRARNQTEIPLLRKEFIIDEYQLYQARALGADAVLLIAAILPEQRAAELTRKAHELGMEILLELHDESELGYILPETDMIGINNRNLATFETDIHRSLKMIDLLPTEKTLISESGLSAPETIYTLRQAGYRGFLMGENLMKGNRPGEELSRFIERFNLLQP